MSIDIKRSSSTITINEKCDNGNCRKELPILHIVTVDDCGMPSSISLTSKEVKRLIKNLRHWEINNE